MPPLLSALLRFCALASIATQLRSPTVAAFSSPDPSTVMPPSSAFAINVRFRVLPAREAEFLSAIKENVRKTMEEEPNALQFALGRDVDDPLTYYLHEEYESRSDHSETHRETDHFKKCMEFFGTDPFAEPHVADEFELCHEGPSAKIANAEAVCLNVELCIKPEVREEFLAVIRQNKAGSDEEPLCLQYSWGENVNEPNTFHFHEQYVGEEGVAAHNAAPHFAKWEEFASTGPFARPPVVQKFSALLD
eukprot:CAMPEP_0172526284 /NCGR_PEP_ID=MMETSP1067-20121228/1226_1 /TAXON_ID=265564 ORGANISM="Thalassiosira punctigera, Strain Tpunct2005C2" /NCGR_SAMPLE_ID=MMETSP1067 /ASSEMBLY_ACC=CAM_ASM_000444 /LENGTH=248 /DNA_ID=CAMNT_0013309755 /DNA_START=97 /DNA_END=843 /DNA_ORIENTATION=-